MSWGTLVAGAALASTVLHAFAQAPAPVHGSADAYVSPGLALAWAVARGADEASTAIVVRVVADSAAYGWISVRGVDPFTKTEQSLVAPRPIGGTLDVRIPRPRFGDTPRTEWMFFTVEAAAISGPPAHHVYYLGVPDTTPEFDDAAKLEAYLAARIARARAASAGKAP